MKNTKQIFRHGIDLFCAVAGTAVYAVAFLMFFSPNRFSPGGVTGLAAVVGQILHLPTGVLVLVMNIPLLLAGVRVFGFKFMALTGVCTVCSSVFLDALVPIVPVYSGDRMMAALAGGVIGGLGLGLTLLRGASTGGTDIAAKLIQRKKPHLSVGRMILLLDAAVVALAALVYGEFESALYSVLAIFTSSKMIDAILYGASRGEIFYIITRRAEQVTGQILQTLGRGVSKIQIVGGYTGKAQCMLMCVVRRQEISRLRSIIKNLDPTAFVVVTPAGDILGEGFKEIP